MTQEQDSHHRQGRSPRDCLARMFHRGRQWHQRHQQHQRILPTKAGARADDRSELRSGQLWCKRKDATRARAAYDGHLQLIRSDDGENPGLFEALLFSMTLWQSEWERIVQGSGLEIVKVHTLRAFISVIECGVANGDR